MDKLTFRETLNRFLLNELRTNRNSICLTADKKEFTSSIGFDAQIPGERLIEMVQSEEANVGAAAGLLNEGFHVFCSLKSGKYMIRALEPIANYLSKYEALGMKSQGSFTLFCPVGYRPYSSMAESESPEALLAHYQGLNLIYASDADDLIGMIKLGMKNHAVSIVLLDVDLLDRVCRDEELPETEGYGARVLRKGGDITVITYGSLVKNALKTAEMAEKNGVETEVIDLRVITPLDSDTIIKSVKKTGRAVVLYKDYKMFSVGSEIAATIVESEAFDYLEAPVKRVSYKGKIMTYSPEATRKEMPHSSELLQTILDLASY